jgi:hypothetical protein
MVRDALNEGVKKGSTPGRHRNKRNLCQVIRKRSQHLKNILFVSQFLFLFRLLEIKTYRKKHMNTPIKR